MVSGSKGPWYSLKDDVRNAGKLEISALEKPWLGPSRTRLVLVN